MKKLLALVFAVAIALTFLTSALAQNFRSNFEIPGRAKPDNTVYSDKWALVVGVSKFQSQIATNSLTAAKNAKDFADMLVKSQRFAKDHVVLLVDDKATRASILSLIGNTYLPRCVESNDLAVVYLASDGLQTTKDVQDSHYLMTYDTSPQNCYSTAIQLERLNQILTMRIPARLVTIIDSPNSGCLVKAKSLTKVTGSDATVGSCGLNEVSLAASQGGNSNFTRHLVEVLAKSPPDTLLTDVLESAVTQVSADAEKAGQHQTVCGEVGKVMLGSQPQAPKPISPSIKPLLPQ